MKNNQKESTVINSEINAELREKIMKGLDLTFEKLLKQKIASDGSFVFLKTGKS